MHARTCCPAPPCPADPSAAARPVPEKPAPPAVHLQPGGALGRDLPGRSTQGGQGQQGQHLLPGEAVTQGCDTVMWHRTVTQGCGTLQGGVMWAALEGGWTRGCDVT